MSTGWILIDNGTDWNSEILNCNLTVCEKVIDLSNLDDLTDYEFYAVSDPLEGIFLMN